MPLRRGYVLLETVVATGLLIVGLAVIGAQIQSADTSVRTMDRKVRAVMLAEQQLAELDMGLIKVDSLDEVEEGDFGPRFPDWGWIMVTEPTAIEGMFRLRLDVYYVLRDGDYQQDDFDYDNADMLFTAYAFRSAPRPVNFAEDFGLNDDEFNDLAEKLSAAGIPGLEADNFNPNWAAFPDFEQFIQVMPIVLDAFGIDFDQLASALPRDVMEQLKEAGLFGENGDTSPDNNGNNGNNGNNNNGNSGNNGNNNYDNNRGSDNPGDQKSPDGGGP